MSTPYGLSSMLKEGHKHFSGLEEAVLKNVEACKAMSAIARTSMGPNGMNKMVINHLEKLFVTSDASTIVSELEVQHPAAKLLVMAAQAQEQEIGDATNLVMTLGGELLSNSEGLLRDGLHPTEVADGYQKAAYKALELLDGLIVEGSTELDVKDKVKVAQRIKGSIASKISGYEGLLSTLVAEACIDVCPKNPHNFNVDSVRVCKLQGGTLGDSTVVKGMVLKRDTEGMVKHMEDAKVVVYTQAVDTSSTDTKGTVLIKTAEELENYSKTEENALETYIKSIHDSGATVIVSGGTFGEMALHFIEKFGMMAIKIPSKFELLRFCKATGAIARSTLGAPRPEELGFAKVLTVQELGGGHCVVLRQDATMGSISTVLIRGSTAGFLEDVERAINDAVNTFKALGKDSRVVPAGGATEIELARGVAAFGKQQTGLDQYAIAKYAESFEIIPRTLAENSGLNATDVIANLYAAHARGEVTTGVDIDGGPPKDLATRCHIVDSYTAKWWAIKLATDAVCTILKVDQIIMSKQSGGPKPNGGTPGDDAP